MSTDSGKWDLKHVPDWQLECVLGEIPDEHLARIFEKLAFQHSSRYLGPVFVEIIDRRQENLISFIPDWHLDAFLEKIPEPDLERAFEKLASRPSSRLLGPVFLKLVKNCQNPLMSFISNKIRSAHDVCDIEDLTQDTLKLAFQNRTRFSCEYRFRSWLFAIAGNLVKNHFRSLSRRSNRIGSLNEDIADTFPDREPDAETTVAAREELSQLRGKCTRERDRRLLDAWIRNRFDGEPWTEITEDMEWDMGPESLRVACTRLVNTLRGNRPRS